MGLPANISNGLEDRIITAREFMQLIGIKSRTTFDKYIKNGTLPPPMEWPPGTSQRGWRRSEAVMHVNQMIDDAAQKGWQNSDHSTSED